MKVKIVVLSVFLILSVALSSCGKKAEQKVQPSDSSVSVNSPVNTNSTQVSQEVGKNAKNNAEALLVYIKKIAEGMDFKRTGNYGKFMYAIGNEYKKDIANPYTGIADMDISNRTKLYFKDNKSEIYKAYSIDFMAIDDYMTDLQTLNTSEVVYCLNPLNKGCTIAFLLMDGAYIYEIDENGNKKNEIKYTF